VRLVVASGGAETFAAQEYENTLKFSNELVRDATDVFAMSMNTRDIEEGVIRLFCSIWRSSDSQQGFMVNTIEWIA
jgi:hypothetical protein